MLSSSRAFMQRNSSWVTCRRTNSWDRCFIRIQCSYMVDTCIRFLGERGGRGGEGERERIKDELLAHIAHVHSVL